MATTLAPSSTVSAPAPTAAAERQRLRWAIVDMLVIARRNLIRTFTEPASLLDVTIQPVLFLLLFAYLFGAAVTLPGGGSYREFLVPGMLVMTLAIPTMGTAVATASDLGTGAIDRFRSLPMSRSGLLAGRNLADMLSVCFAIACVGVTGLIIGWGIHDGPARAVGGLALMLVFACAMGWVGILLGVRFRDPEVAQQTTGMFVFTLVFMSNVLVPARHLAGWLQAVVDWNPLSAVATAARQLFGNPNPATASSAWPMQHPIAAALVWCVFGIAVCAPLAVRSYRTRTSA
jgi:ABC-2 type transport system permease protein